MVVRIQLKPGPRLARQIARHRDAALLMGALLSPAAMMAFVLGCWRLGADLNWMGRFAISRGLFSHWQVWMALACLLQTCGSLLTRYGRGGRREVMP
jgi:hypothetical protein